MYYKLFAYYSYAPLTKKSEKYQIPTDLSALIAAKVQQYFPDFDAELFKSFLCENNSPNTVRGWVEIFAEGTYNSLPKRFKEIVAIVMLNPKKEQKEHEKTNLISDLNKIVNDNLNNEKLNMTYLSVCLNISPSKLYREIKLLTGKTPTDYICNIKIKNAIQLMALGLSISEAAYNSGFNNHSYFTKCFKKVTGLTPTQFMLQIA